MPSVKVILMLSAIVMTICFVDNSAASPYPSIGNSKGKTKRLGNCAFFVNYNFPQFMRKFSFIMLRLKKEKVKEAV